MTSTANVLMFLVIGFVSELPVQAQWPATAPPTPKTTTSATTTQAADCYCRGTSSRALIYSFTGAHIRVISGKDCGAPECNKCGTVLALWCDDGHTLKGSSTSSTTAVCRKQDWSIRIFAQKCVRGTKP